MYYEPDVQNMELQLIPAEYIVPKYARYFHNRLMYELKEFAPKEPMNMKLNDEPLSGLPTLDNKGRKKLYYIDAIGKGGEFTYIIEVEPKLNYIAIGQVCVYGYLYQKHLHEKDKEKIKKVIFCNDTTDQALLCTCSKYDITVFELTKNGVEKHSPNAV